MAPKPVNKRRNILTAGPHHAAHFPHGNETGFGTRQTTEASPRTRRFGYVVTLTLLTRASDQHQPVVVIVLEASERSATVAADPANALAALELSVPAKKKRRFQLVTTLTDGHTAADDLLQQLACP